MESDDDDYFFPASDVSQAEDDEDSDTEWADAMSDFADAASDDDESEFDSESDYEGDLEDLEDYMELVDDLLFDAVEDSILGPQLLDFAKAVEAAKRGVDHSSMSDENSDSESLAEKTTAPQLTPAPKKCALMAFGPNGQWTKCDRETEGRHAGLLQGVWEVDETAAGCPVDAICVCRAHDMADRNAFKKVGDVPGPHLLPASAGGNALQSPTGVPHALAGNLTMDGRHAEDAAALNARIVRCKCRRCNRLCVVIVPAATSPGDRWVWAWHSQKGDRTSPYLRIPTLANCDSIVNVPPPEQKDHRNRAGYICPCCLRRSGVHLRLVGQGKGARLLCDHRRPQAAATVEEALAAGDWLLNGPALPGYSELNSRDAQRPRDEFDGAAHQAPTTGDTSQVAENHDHVNLNTPTTGDGAHASPSAQGTVGTVTSTMTNIASVAADLFYSSGRSLATAIESWAKTIRDDDAFCKSEDPAALVASFPPELLQFLDGLTHGEGRRAADAKRKRAKRGKESTTDYDARRALRLLCRKALLGCLIITMVRPALQPSLLQALTVLHRSRRYNYDMGVLGRQMGLYTHQPKRERELEVSRNAQPVHVQPAPQGVRIVGAVDNIDKKKQGPQAGDAFSTPTPDFHGTVSVAFVPVDAEQVKCAGSGLAKQGVRRNNGTEFTSGQPRTTASAAPTETSERACERLPPIGDESLDWFAPGPHLRDFEERVERATAEMARVQASAEEELEQCDAPGSAVAGMGGHDCVERLKIIVEDMCDRGKDELLAEVVILPTSKHAATTGRGVEEALGHILSARAPDQEAVTVVADQAVYAKAEKVKDADPARLAAVQLYPGMCSPSAVVPLRFN